MQLRRLIHTIAILTWQNETANTGLRENWIIFHNHGKMKARKGNLSDKILQNLSVPTKSFQLLSSL